ncbi:immunity protein Imm33 domain-containing protein [Paenibacillus silviterrae]|uniref:immunity protein Imm33 domain-containing protein n=1 Tax=Paenibacillus silviterrae TaxID=3242194 RepID=UPI0025431DEC|nr:hypothetical protein [Paenibacillus chinjuensis]
MEIKHKGIKLQYDADYYVTNGLESVSGFEIKVANKDRTTMEYHKVLIYLIDYIFNTKAVIKPEQTIAYYSWLLKFVPSSDSCYDLWEFVNEDGMFTEGIEYSANLIQMQEKVCNSKNTKTLFPFFGQKVAISRGVYEGMDCEGVRYPSPDHMTGWYITTDQYDGNFQSLMVVHYYHLAFKRTDLLPYLALPYGFRFSKYESKIEVWLDSTIQEYE